MRVFRYLENVNNFVNIIIDKNISIMYNVNIQDNIKRSVKSENLMKMLKERRKRRCYQYSKEIGKRMEVLC